MTNPGTAIKLRPSDSSRWLECTASPVFIAGLTEEGRLVEEKHDYTDEGSMAHELAQELFHGREVFFPNKEMEHHITDYVNFVRSYEEEGTETLIEHEVPVFYDPDNRRGFIDAVVVNEAKNIVTVIDLKYGAGVSIQARNNPQLAIYGRSIIEALWDLYELTEKTLVRLMIWQPRIIGENPVRMWNLTFAELVAATKKIESTAAHILNVGDPGRELHFYAESEDVCRFCPAQAVCPVRAAHLLGELPVDTQAVLSPKKGKLPLPPVPDTLSVEQVGAILGREKEIRKWLDHVVEYAKNTLHSGGSVPGWKLVARQGNRSWNDEEAAAKFLRGLFKKPEYIKESLISPTQAEKLLKARDKTRPSTVEKFGTLVIRPESNPTLAPESDPRPSVVVNTKEEFQEKEGEEDDVDGSDLL